MTGPGALALTAVVLLFASFIITLSMVEESRPDKRKVRLGWLIFAASCASFIASAWWDALG